MKNIKTLFPKKMHFFFLFAIITLAFLLTIEASGQLPKIKVACVGNSITYGATIPNRLVNCYPAQLQVFLDTIFWEVKNYGSNSRTMLKNSGYSYWDDKLYDSTLAYNPDKVVIGLGTNDSKDFIWDPLSSEFEGDYMDMVHSFQELSGKPEIWIYLLIPGEQSAWGIYNTYIKDSVNPEIKKIALKYGLNLVDMYTLFGERKPEWYHSDGVHTTTLGAGLMAQEIGKLLLTKKPIISYSNDTVVAPDSYGYQWYIDGIPVDTIDGGIQKSMKATQPGIYTVSVKLFDTSETRMISRKLHLPIENTITNTGLNVYPNPGEDILSIETKNYPEGEQYRITDLLGKTILSGILYGNTTININMLPSGMYVLNVGDDKIKLFKR